MTRLPPLPIRDSALEQARQYVVLVSGQEFTPRAVKDLFANDAGGESIVGVLETLEESLVGNGTPMYLVATDYPERMRQALTSPAALKSLETNPHSFSKLIFAVRIQGQRPEDQVAVSRLLDCPVKHRAVVVDEISGNLDLRVMVHPHFEGNEDDPVETEFRVNALSGAVSAGDDLIDEAGPHLEWVILTKEAMASIFTEARAAVEEHCRIAGVPLYEGGPAPGLRREYHKGLEWLLGSAKAEKTAVPDEPAPQAGFEFNGPGS